MSEDNGFDVVDGKTDNDDSAGDDNNVDMSDEDEVKNSFNEEDVVVVTAVS